MRIEERSQLDYSEPDSSLFGRGSKNSGPTRNFPFNDPGWRLPFSSPTGTSRATGFDPRAMITSSPAEAFLINRERVVLAWWMVTTLLAAPWLTHVSSQAQLAQPSSTSFLSISNWLGGSARGNRSAARQPQKRREKF